VHLWQCIISLSSLCVANMAARAYNNATSLLSRAQIEDPPLHELYEKSRSAKGKYDDRTLDVFKVRVRTSSILPNEFGVFAKRHIRMDTPIVVLPLNFRLFAETMDNPDYTFPLPQETYNDIVVDMWELATANFARFFNSDEDSQNIEIYWRGAVGVAQTIRDVQSGDELFLNYVIN
jgi:hypothetical protein